MNSENLNDIIEDKSQENLIENKVTISDSGDYK